jgi:hypothetical protein
MAAWCGICLVQSAMADGAAFSDSAETLAPAADDAWPAFEAAVEFCTRQLTYGLVDNRDPIVTAEAAAEWHGFTFESAMIFDTTDWGEKHGGYGDRTGKYQELAFGPGYTCAFSPETLRFLPTTVEMFVNYIYEYHPPVRKALGEENPDTQFINVGAALPDLWLEPAFSVEFDIDNEDGAAYLAAGVGHTFALVRAAGGRETDPLSLALGAGVGLGNPERNEYDAGYRRWAFKDAWVSAALEWRITDRVALTPYVAACEQLSSRLRAAARHAIDGETHSSAH